MNTTCRTSVLAVTALLAAAAPAAGQTPPYTLDTLRVQVGARAPAALPAGARSVEILTRDDIARSPARTLADVLAMAAGFDALARSDAQADFSIRGGSFEQVLVLVDGVRMSDHQTGHFDLDLAIPLQEIERVEVLRGGASALYGSDAMTGVVNVVTRRGGEGIEASVEGGSFGARAASASAAATLGGVRLRGGGELRSSDGHRPGTDYENVLARLSAEAELAGGTLGAELGHGRRDFGAANFYGAYPSYEETRTTTAALSWRSAGGAGPSVEPRVHFRRHEDDFVLFREEPERYHNVHESRQLGGELVVRHTLGDALGLAAGGEWVLERLESTNLGDHDERRGALFAELAAGTAGRATVTAGARWDHHSAFGGFLAPSLAAALWPRPDLRLRASFTRGFRAPSANELYYTDPANVGDPDLGAERSHELEAGAELRPGARVRLSLAAFRRSATDLIDWAKPAGAAASEPWRTMNVERAVFRGVEAEAEVRGPREGLWTAGASLLSFESSDEGGYVSKYALRPLTRTYSLAVRQPLGRGLHLFLRGAHARRSGDEAYLLLDGRLALERGRFEIFLDGRNLSDARYRDVSVVAGQAPPPAAPGELEVIAAPGRSLHAGVAIRLP